MREKRRVLIIDDRSDDRARLSAFLERVGYTVEATDNLEKGEDYLERHLSHGTPIETLFLNQILNKAKTSSFFQRVDKTYVSTGIILVFDRDEVVRGHDFYEREKITPVVCVQKPYLLEGSSGRHQIGDALCYVDILRKEKLSKKVKSLKEEYA